MTSYLKSVFAGLAAQHTKTALSILSALAVGGAWADDPAWLVWDAGGGDDTYFTTAANWSNDAAPSADTNASREFASASMGKTVTFNTADESVGAIFVRNLWNKTDALTPVVFEAKDSNQSYGFVAARAFSAADVKDSRSAFTIKSGTYKATGWSLWAYGANSSLDAKIKGGTVSLNGGVGIAEGVGGNVTSRVDVCGGTLAIEGGDMLIGLNSDADSLAEISVSNDGVISCGENVEKWIVLGHGGSYAGTVHFNIDAGGTLKAWRIEKRSSTTTTKAKINFNGGTLAALGEKEIIGAGIDVVIGSNGGTIDVGANNVTIAAPVTGSGTIIKKGSGTLTFTGDMSGFTGKLQVRDGKVVVPSANSSVKAGIGTLKTINGSNIEFVPITRNLYILDYEDGAVTGWSKTKEYNSANPSEQSVGERLLVQKDENDEYIKSKFFKITTYNGGAGVRGQKWTYSVPNIAKTIDDYIFEFDWFATQNTTHDNKSQDLGLYIYDTTEKEIIRLISNPVIQSDKIQIFLNGSTTAESIELASAPAKNYSGSTDVECSGSSNQDKWYHVIVRGSSYEGVTLEIIKNDLKTIVFNETRVCDFANLGSMVLDICRQRNNFYIVGGMDDFIVSTPADAAFNGVGYATLQEAVDAAVIYPGESKTIYLLNDVAENIELSVAGIVINLGAFSITGTVTGGAGITATYDSTENTWTSAAASSTYTWQNTTGDNQWATPGNWLAGSSVATAAPNSDSTVVFPAAETDWTVQLTADVSVEEVKFYGATSLSGAVVFANAISGDAAIILSNGAGLGNRGAEITFSNPIRVDAGGSANNILYAYNADLNYSGTLTGTGNLQFRVTAGYGVNYSGTCSDFAGFILVLNTDGNNTSTLSGRALSGSNKAKWCVYNYSNNNNTGAAPNFVDGTGQTVYFGELTGSYQRCRAANYGSSNTLVIGGLNTSFSLGGQFGTDNAGRYEKIRKVGTGTMTFTGTWAGAYEINCGVLYLASASSYPSKADNNTYVQFNGGELKLDPVYTQDISTNIARSVSTATIIIDDGGANRTWEVAIPSTHTQGFTKKGTGTLTLSAKPLYTGATTVEAGTLVVNAGEAWSDYTLGANTKVTVDNATHTYTFTHLTAEEKPEAVEGVITVPASMDGVSAVYAIAPGETIDCSALTTASGIKATITATVGGQTVDMTSYYTDSSLTVNGSKIIAPQLDSVKVGVDLGETDEGVDPVVFTTTTPTFNLKNSVKKGLYYGVGTITDPTAVSPSVSVLEEQQATADGQEISLSPTPNFGEGNALYYKLSVSDTAQKTP